MSNFLKNPIRIAPSTAESKRFYGGCFSDKKNSLEEWMAALQTDKDREHALRFLVDRKETHGLLGPLVWNTAGIPFVLLKEIIVVYGHLSTASLTKRTSTRVCNVLFLMQCVASDHTTRKQFIAAEIPSYIFPLFSTKNKDPPHEYLRISGLGVIGKLVEDGDVESIEYLLKSEVFPNILYSMDMGSELSKTVAMYIVHKILKTDVGLRYCCCMMDRFYAVTTSMSRVVNSIIENPSKLLLKYTIFCYHKLSGYPRARAGFKNWLPVGFKNEVIINIIRDDSWAMETLQQFFDNIGVEFNH